MYVCKYRLEIISEKKTYVYTHVHVILTSYICMYVNIGWKLLQKKKKKTHVCTYVHFIST